MPDPTDPTGLRQPDARSCAAACVVVARMLATGEEPGDFGAEVLATHRRLTSYRDLDGRLQLPWPRALGTPPWAVARALTSVTGVRYRTRLARLARLAPLSPGDQPAAFYVGDRWTPRHVALVLPGEPLRCYEPHRGEVVPLPRGAAHLPSRGLGGWHVRWFLVVEAS